jgi:hypothetical protein
MTGVDTPFIVHNGRFYDRATGLQVSGKNKFSIAVAELGVAPTKLSSPNVFTCSLKRTLEGRIVAVTPFVRVRSPGSLASFKFTVGLTDTGENTTAAKASLPQVAGASVTTLNAASGLGWQDGGYGEFAATGTGFAGSGSVSDRPEIVMGGRIALPNLPRSDVIGALPCLITRVSIANADATNKWDFGASSVAMETPSVDNRGRILQYCSSGGVLPLSTSMALSPTTAVDVGAIIEYETAGVSAIFVGNSTFQLNGISADVLSSIGLRTAAIGSALFPFGQVNNAASSCMMGNLGAGDGGYAASALLATSQGLGFNAMVVEGVSPNDLVGAGTAPLVQARCDYMYNNILNYFYPDSVLRGYKLFVTSGLPYPAGLTTAALDAPRLAYLAQLKALAAQGKIIYIPTAEYISDTASPAGFNTDYSFGDGIHENVVGADGESAMIAAALLGYFGFMGNTPSTF